MKTLNRYRVRCTTDDKYEYVWRDAAEAAPSTCPVDTAHTIDATKTSVVEALGQENKYDRDGNLKAVGRISAGGGFRKISHNFCDKATWWQESAGVVDESTTETTPLLAYTLVNGGVLIDVRHARLTFEDMITAATVAPNGTTMANILPVVKVNGVALAQGNEDAASGNDRYTLNYDIGRVTFAVARGAGDVVTVSCRRAGTSKYTFKPGTGKKMILEDAEVDCSEDLDMIAHVQTVAYGSHSTLTGGTVVPVDTKTYKTMHDFQAAAREFFGPLPANFGLTGGINSPKWTFKWQYGRADVLYDTLCYVNLNLDPDEVTGNKLVLQTKDDVELGGSVCTVAFYGAEVKETNG